MADRMSAERETQIRAHLAETSAGQDFTTGDAAARDLLAELDAIRTTPATTGGVLYDVIRRARAGELDEHEAVRQIERRLIHPLAASRREALGLAGRRARQIRAQRDDTALAAEADHQRHGQEITEYDRRIGELVDERRAAEAEVERLRLEARSVRADVLAAARISWDRTVGSGGDLQEALHSALGIDYDTNPYSVTR